MSFLTSNFKDKLFCKVNMKFKTRTQNIGFNDFLYPISTTLELRLQNIETSVDQECNIQKHLSSKQTRERKIDGEFFVCNRDVLFFESPDA